jgi:hypothetical protein
VRSDFYVYEHLKADTGEVFYVGKGFGSRAERTNNRNRYWHNTVNKHGFSVRFLVKNVDEEFALLAEQERIDQLRKLGVNLCNLTSGGEGVTGYKHTEETRKLLSSVHAGRKISKWLSEKFSKLRKGIPKTEETKKKISESNKGKKRSAETRQRISNAKGVPVVCVETGVEYKSAVEASQKTGVYRTSITAACVGKRKTAGGFRWRHR